MMNTFKRILTFLMVMALLACVPVATSAETELDASQVIDEAVLHSITVEEETGKGLAFFIKMNVKGAQVNSRNEFVNTNATATIDGVEYKVIKMGAVLTNQADCIARIDDLTLADVNENKTVLDIPAKYLCQEPETDSCAFAVRIIRLPATALGRVIACRPYVVIEKNGAEETFYGGGDISTYNKIYYTHNEEETPVLDVTGMGDVDDKIVATAGSAEYVAYETTNYVEAFKVNLTLQNSSANAITSAGDAVTYSFKDANGAELGKETVVIDALNPGESKNVEFYAPIGTATIEAIDSDLNYVPVITLPAIGSDIDVTKKKNRIRVSAAEASFNEDGTIHVALTFKNYTSNWITEETDYVQYTYYDVNGTKIKTETIYIGVIDTKKHPVKTFEFDLPATAASVKITKSKIVYWTEWA